MAENPVGHERHEHRRGFHQILAIAADTAVSNQIVSFCRGDQVDSLRGCSALALGIGKALYRTSSTCFFLLQGTK